MNILMTLNEREYGELSGGKEVKVEVDEYIMYAPGVFKITIEDEFKQSGTIFVKESGQIESIDSGIEIISGFFCK